MLALVTDKSSITFSGSRSRHLEFSQDEAPPRDCIAYRDDTSTTGYEHDRDEFYLALLHRSIVLIAQLA